MIIISSIYKYINIFSNDLIIILIQYNYKFSLIKYKCNHDNDTKANKYINNIRIKWLKIALIKDPK